VSLPATQIARLRRRAFRLEYATMTWMIAEAATAITAGAITASIALIGFGLDSVVELFSAGIVISSRPGKASKAGRKNKKNRNRSLTSR
jgi:hypothetical protein